LIYGCFLHVIFTNQINIFSRSSNALRKELPLVSPLRKKSFLKFFKKILPCDQDAISSQGLLSQRDEKQLAVKRLNRKYSEMLPLECANIQGAALY